MKIKSVKVITTILVILTIAISMLDLINVTAALYASKGDVIPSATIEYNKDDNASVFPKSYQEKINKLKEVHPNWAFMAVYTNLDWAETVKHESYDINVGISLVPMNYASEWKRDGKNYFQDGTWVTASKEAVAYALDPRNYLNENEIFQFESLSCVESVHTVEAVEKVLKGTDLETKYTKDESGNDVVEYPSYVNINNITEKMEKTYSQIIYDAGVESGVSPIHIATRIIQETGGKLSMGSISGKNEGFIGYYNFFNIGAVPGADGNSAVTNGLITAKNNGCNSPEKSIRAGAITLYNSYIKYGQDTVYFQKFDVSNSKGNATMLYACQYMTNILAPSSESKLTYKAYSDLGIVDSSFVFYIPVYKNRPLEPAAQPGKTSNTEVLENDNPEEEKTEPIPPEENTPEEEKKEPIKVMEITSSSNSYSVNKGEIIEAILTVLPENATDKNYTSKVEDEKIVKIEGNKITGLEIGETKVTFITNDGNFEVTINIIVKDGPDYKINTEKLKITEDNKIVDILPESNIKMLTDNITIKEGIRIEIKNVNGDIIAENGIVGTNSVVTILKGEEKLAEYTIVVKADVNGDGKVSASDYVLIKNTIMGTATLKDTEMLASDVNADSKTNASDYVLIKNHIMGISKLY